MDEPLVNLSILSLEMMLRNRKIKLNWLFISLQTVDMCLSKLSLLSIVISNMSNSLFTGKEN